MRDELETEHVDKLQGSTDASLLWQTAGTPSTEGVRKLVN